MQCARICRIVYSLRENGIGQFSINFLNKNASEHTLYTIQSGFEVGFFIVFLTCTV